MTSPITTHVLDLALGKPAQGLVVHLQQIIEGTYADVADGITNADGRIMDLLAAGELAPGLYRLRFETGRYFNSIGQTDFFYPSVTIEFSVTEVKSHYHVPLLLSPFGYSTYRGS